MSKYSNLGKFLKERGLSSIPMTFSDIEKVIGFKLPNSQKHQAWWSNSTSNNVMTQVWLDAGYRTEQVDTVSRKLVFRKVAGNGPTYPQAGGMSDAAREFKMTGVADKKPMRSPLFGALKGTFTLVPPSDSEPPPEDPDSWEALALAKLDRLLFGKGS